MNKLIKSSVIVLATLFSLNTAFADNPYKIEGLSPSLYKEVIKNVPYNSNDRIYAVAIEKYLEAGHYYPKINLNENTRIIKIKIGKLIANGKYKGYFPKNDEANAQIILDSLPMIQADALSHNQKLVISASPDRDGNLVIDTSSTPLAKPIYGGGTSFSTFGPRFSSGDVVSQYGYANIDGYNLTGSITKGLPGLNKDSLGGNYLGETFGISHPTEEGILLLNISNSFSKIGGPDRGFDIKGNESQAVLDDKYYLNQSTFIHGGIGVETYTSKLGILGWKTNEQNSYADIGIDHKGEFESHNITYEFKSDITQGLVGSQNSFGNPSLLPKAGGNFTTITSELNAEKKLNKTFVLKGTVGGQLGTGSTPVIQQMYIGGPGRGSAVQTGAFSGASGAYGEAKITTVPLPIKVPFINQKINIEPYVGFNGGMVTQLTGPMKNNVSAEIGLQSQISKSLTADFGVSQSVIGKGASVGVSLQWNF
jgi:hypothetical protein